MNHPISDFKEMLNYRDEDLFESAVKQMKGIILVMINTGKIEKALECLKVLRSSSIDEYDPSAFNDFLIFLKQQVKK